MSWWNIGLTNSESTQLTISSLKVNGWAPVSLDFLNAAHLICHCVAFPTPTLIASETHTVQDGLHDTAVCEDEKLILRVKVGRAESGTVQFCEIPSSGGFIKGYIF